MKSARLRQISGKWPDAIGISDVVFSMKSGESAMGWGV